jgi:hypothetical protein
MDLHSIKGTLMNRTQCVFTLFVMAACLAISGVLHAEPSAMSPAGFPITNGLNVVYDPASGHVTATAPGGTFLTALELRSQSAAFVGSCENLSGPFDVCNEGKIFKLDTEGFGTIDFGAILPAGMSGAALLEDLMVDGASKGGGFLTGEGVFLVQADFVPEPIGGSLFVGGALLLGLAVRSRLRHR